MVISGTVISILVGIASGIIAAALLGLLNILLRKAFFPWLEEFVYKGVNVSGNWIYKNESTKQIFEIRMELEQKAHRLSGKFQAKTDKREEKEEYVNYYKVQGVVKDNYLLLTYTAERKDRTGVGSFLLRVSHGGTELIGNVIYTPDGVVDDTQIVSLEDIAFTRN
ncbi:MAG: hypothetical protein WCW36_01755 [Candidatus Paceibacterota bacterium]|jgi:hypothetical protein